MRRLVLIAIAAAAIIHADTTRELNDLFARMASALSDANPQDFLRAIDENKRCRIPRLSIGKALVANGTGQPFGPIGRDSAFDRRIRGICAHQHLLLEAACR